MASISSAGIGSGLDVKSIVDQLVSADILPAKTRIDRREFRVQSQVSALGQIKSSLAGLQSALSKLGSLKDFYSLSVNSSEPNHLSATATGNPSTQSYQLEVKALAKKATLASVAFPSSSTSIGTGSITIALGTYNDDLTTFTDNPDKNPLTINIASGQDNLLAIRDAINKSGQGVNASIIQDGTGSRLVITSPETGKKNEIKITIADSDTSHTNNTGLSRLAYDPTNNINQLTQQVAASDSEVLINGLTLKQSSNTLKDAIEGLTIELKKEEIGKKINLSVEQSKGQVTTNINEFIKKYNETTTLLNSLTFYNNETKTAGVFQGDTGTRTLKNELTGIINNLLPVQVGNIKTLTDLGIKTDKQGLLTLDTKKFQTVLDNNYFDIGKIFAKTATSTDPNITVNTVPNSIKAGDYPVNLSAYTPGSVLTGTIGLIQANSTDGLTLSATGNLNGLSINVQAGTTGYRGSIIVSDGLIGKLNSVVDRFIGEKGDITQRNAELKKVTDDIATQRADLETKRARIEKRYLRQFQGLDAMVSRLQQTSNFLSQQLAKL